MENTNILNNTTKLNSLKNLEYNRQNIYLKILYENLINSLDNNESDDIRKIKLSYINNLFFNFNFKINKLLESDIIPLLIIPLVSNCKLNCKHCDAYSPLCEKDTYNNTNESIISNISHLLNLGFEIQEISLEGGEPLLYKDLKNLLYDLRRILPTSSIVITTNGLLLKSLDNSTINSIIYNNILLVVDQYFNKPIEYDSKLNNNIINNKSYSDTGYFYKAPIDINKQIDPKITDEDWSHYLLCEKSHTCVTLIKDKLYICGKSAYIKNFNDYFKLDFPYKGLNVLNSNKKEIQEFIITPSPLCKYCKFLKKTYNNYMPSNKSIDEWVD